MSDSLQINQSVLSLISKGDEQAFRVLFDHYKDRFYYVALKMTSLEDIAEETVQEVFIQLWRQRTSLANVENPDAYFFTVLYRQVYQYYRKMALDKKLHLALQESLLAKNTTDETVLSRESEQFIREAIARLPAQQQEVFKLSKEDGLSREEIAEKMQISPNTVRNHLAQAMRSVRTYLHDLAIISGIISNFLSDS